jgi:hypothetical protein
MHMRYEIVQQGGTWLVGLDGPAVPGLLTKQDAISFAIRTALDAERRGDKVEIFVWDEGRENRVYSTLMAERSIAK